MTQRCVTSAYARKDSLRRWRGDISRIGFDCVSESIRRTSFFSEASVWPLFPFCSSVFWGREWAARARALDFLTLVSGSVGEVPRVFLRGT